jgi:lysophospholipase L1-like esterase
MKKLHLPLLTLFLSCGLFAASPGARAQETVIIADPLQTTTIGTQVGGKLSTDGFAPGIGGGHILYTLPAKLTDGAVEVEMRGMTVESIRRGKESKAAWISMYDARGLAEPVTYDDFKQNFFRSNIGWNFHVGKFQCTLVTAAPTAARHAAPRAVFGPKFEDRDFSTEPSTQTFTWDATHWYHLRYEWQGGQHRLLVDGVEVWSVNSPYAYAPDEHHVRIGSGPGREEKFYNQIAALTFRNVRIVALPARPVHPPADFPAEKNDVSGKFMERHRAFLERAKGGPIDLLFLGDSITERWAENPLLWDKYFGAYHPANFGIGGDQTQHLLWRLTHGELDGIHPKAVVLLIGTNNTGSHSAAEIAGATRRTLRIIREKAPEAKVVLLGVFPRGARLNRNGSLDDGVQRMAVIRELNPLLAQLADGNRVHYLDLTQKFLAADGTIPKELMPDQLHLSAEGYRVWAEGMQAKLSELLP